MAELLLLLTEKNHATFSWVAEVPQSSRARAKEAGSPCLTQHCGGMVVLREQQGSRSLIPQISWQFPDPEEGTCRCHGGASGGVHKQPWYGRATGLQPHTWCFLLLSLKRSPVGRPVILSTSIAPPETQTVTIISPWSIHSVDVLVIAV